LKRGFDIGIAFYVSLTNYDQLKKPSKNEVLDLFLALGPCGKCLRGADFISGRRFDDGAWWWRIGNTGYEELGLRMCEELNG
jgi:hypothetical protein